MITKQKDDVFKVTIGISTDSVAVKDYGVQLLLRWKDNTNNVYYFSISNLSLLEVAAAKLSGKYGGKMQKSSPTLLVPFDISANSSTILYCSSSIPDFEDEGDGTIQIAAKVYDKTSTTDASLVAEIDYTDAYNYTKKKTTPTLTVSMTFD